MNTWWDGGLGGCRYTSSVLRVRPSGATAYILLQDFVGMNFSELRETLGIAATSESPREIDEFYRAEIQHVKRRYQHMPDVSTEIEGSLNKRRKLEKMVIEVEREMKTMWHREDQLFIKEVGLDGKEAYLKRKLETIKNREALVKEREALLVAGTRQFQEIINVDSGSDGEIVGVIENVSKPKCCACLGPNPCVMYLKCRHVCYCEDCGSPTPRTISRCPICRKSGRREKVFFS